MDPNSKAILICVAVAAAAGVFGLSLTSARNAKVSLLGRRIATFVMLVGIAVALLLVAIRRS